MFLAFECFYRFSSFITIRWKVFLSIIFHSSLLFLYPYTRVHLTCPFIYACIHYQIYTMSKTNSLSTQLCQIAYVQKHAPNCFIPLILRFLHLTGTFFLSCLSLTIIFISFIIEMISNDKIIIFYAAHQV